MSTNEILKNYKLKFPFTQNDLHEYAKSLSSDADLIKYFLALGAIEKR